jgi:amino acid adenylation domain-containing protein
VEKQVDKLDKNNLEDILPLTPMQESMLYQYLSEPETDQYFEQMSLRLNGIIDNAAFIDAWQAVADNNEVLRTVYRWDKLEQPVQVIWKYWKIPIREFDCSGLKDQEKLNALNEIKENDYREKVDIRTAPFRITLCKLDDENYEMIISNHHILYDGWSNGILLNEFMEAYQRLSEGKQLVFPPKSKYKDYLKWLRSQDQTKQKSYWQDYLKGFNEKTLLPFERKQRVDSYRADEFNVILPQNVTAKITEFAKQNNLSPATLFYAAWGILLQKYGNSKDVVFGTTVSGRTQELKGIQDIVGLFINTLPLRIKADSDLTIKALIDMVQANLYDREDFECASLSDIKLWSEIGGGENLFDSIVVVENYPLSQRLTGNPGQIQITDYEIHERTNFDLTLAVMAFDRIEFKLIYNDALFHRETIESLMNHYSSILDQIISNYDLKLADLQMLSLPEQNQLIEEYNNTKTDFPKTKTLVELFEDQVLQFPDHPAIIHEDQRMTYSELNQKANQVAAFLRTKGVVPNRCVGLIIERSPEMIIFILGVLKAGGAYLPLDHEFPKDRTLNIIKDANPILLIIQENLIGKFSDAKTDFQNECSLDVLTVEEVMASIGNFPVENPQLTNKSEDLAYIMYTSGSTGIPKGILIKHYNISRVVKNTNYLEITKDDVVLQLSNYAFDGSTFDIYGAILNGAQLVLAKKETVLDISRLADLIRKENISVFFITTALFNTMIDLEAECLKGVRKVLFGGERVSFQHVKQALQILGKDKIIHVYGPTESTVFATYYPINEVDEGLGTIPIGKPIANTEVYILDNEMKLLPKGAPGELYIGGDGLAGGYLNRPDLTEERFVKNPFREGIIYKTGDQVRYLADGNIVFLDRLDNQVKLRGFRIELGEIEKALLNHEKIREAVVLVREDQPGNKYLCAYLVADEELALSEIRAHLLKTLPDYMVPASIVFLNEIPLTSNGKIDQKALRQYETSVDYTADNETPSSQLEIELQNIWREVLGVANIGINTNFFEVGGHSLKATIVASKIHKRLDIEVPLGEIFKNPTIKELARFIDNSERQSLTPILPVPQQGYYEVSSAQKRMYLQEHFEGIGISYNMPIALDIEGLLDRERLENVINALVNKHEPFRTSFKMTDGRIVQQVHPQVDFQMGYEELLDGAHWDKQRIDLKIKDFIKPFDLEKAPLLRVKLIKVSAGKHLLLLDMHHIISDGMSLVLFIKELSGLYQGKEIDNLEIQYKDYAIWQNEFQKNELFKKQENYWLNKFSDEIPLLNMPYDYLRPERKSFEGKNYRFSIPSEATAKLNQLALENNTTLNALLISIYSIMINRYSGQNDLVIGSLVAGRSHHDVENMIGMFNNFLPIRINLNAENRFVEFLRTANQSILDAYENQDYPYDMLIEKLVSTIDPSRNPFFDTMLIFHNELESLDEIRFGELKVKNYEVQHDTSKLDFKLDIYLDNSSKELNCILEYSLALFKPSTIERMAGHFQNIIKEVIENPEINLTEIQMITPVERRQILQEFNNTEAKYPKDWTIYQLYEAQVEQNPNHPAAIFEEGQLTYSELNRKANQLARVLREKGVTRDSIVGILLERSPEMMIGLMATLKAGGAYLPISPEYPEERINYMLRDSRAVILLTNAKFKDKAAFDGEVLCLEDKGLYTGDDSNPALVNKPTDLAYVIYTSGSTGKPKGAMIEHYSLVNRLNWMQKQYSIGPEDLILQKTPYTFDVSVWELFWWSMTGAAVCFLKPGGEKDPEAIVEAIEKNRITAMHFVPSMLTAFLGYLENGVNPERLKSLRQVFASGEALKPQQAAKFNRLLFETNGTKLHNLYGPTEATVDVSYFDCSTGEELETIPIGKPIDNINLYVLNQANQLQPVGVPGELHIAGDGLARGYLNRPKLTTERFVDNPFRPGERMYKTGDLARWLPDGNIEYLDRIDNQVKVRGFRIELGEIEAELLKHEQIKEAVVSARDDKEGNKYLCAYLVTEAELPVMELRDYLSRSLPEYMIPSYFIRIEQIPLTPNGKVDRNALPVPEGDINTGRAYEAPTNEIEENLVNIWKEVLGVDRIGINDDFFELGGHSLKAAGLAVKIHKSFNTGLTLGEIFEASTVKKMALLIAEAREKEFIPIESIAEKEYHEVSSSQKRLFIINQLEGDNTTYNLPSMVMVEGKLDLDRFKKVFTEMIRRHESLRTSFKLIGDEPVQTIHDEVEFEVEYGEATEDKLKDLAKGFIRPFDLGQAPLIRVSLLKINPEKHLLMFDLHHIIADGVSSVILVKEFAQLYAGAELPELKLQYKDFAAWQNRFNESEEIIKQQEYWLNMFQGKIPVLNLPTDFPRPSIQSSEGDKLSLKLDPKMINDLKKVAAEQGATLYMALFAVYNTLLFRYTGQEDIIIGSPTAGRQHADVENMIGMFVNTLALRSFPEGSKSFYDFLGEVKNNALLAYENQDYQFERLVDTLDLPRDISRNPMFDTMFVLQNMAIPKLELEGLQFLPYPFETKAAKFDLTLEIVEDDADPRLNIEYCTRLFKPSTIERLAQHFQNIIRNVIDNPKVRLAEVEMISDMERRQILQEFNNTEAKYPKDRTIYQLYEAQVEQNPNHPAAIFEEGQLTYSELNRKANQLARVLREKGVTRDSIVGILLERSPEMMIGLMATLKAGGAYLPISPEYPEERINYMLRDSRAVILLTNAKFKDKAAFDGEVLCLEDKGLYTGDDSNPALVNKPTDLAYVIYTSGSTGKPKGAMIEHYSLVNRLNWMQKQYSIGPEDLILQKTPYTFDVSVWELFWWSMTGAAVCFLKPGGEKDPEAIVEAIEKNRITAMHFVPSMLTAFLGYLENGVNPERLKSLRQVFASGEALKPQQAAKFNRLLFETNGTKLHNLYGPTEATVDVSYFDCSTGEELETIPIGKPIDNINLYVLNQANQLQPVGVPGELHIAGDGLARGYLNRPKLTTERFVDNPFRPGERMYKTGDLARWLPDGNIEYLDRIDNQVKVRGFRIELGEIEAELLKHEQIKEAVVSARDDKEGNKYLCAYLVTEAELPVMELRDYLSRSLPEYMIPSYFIRIEQIPLTPNGKVDRNALPVPEGDINTGRAYEAPTNEIEENLVNIWKEVLGVDRIGINDRFFELGGYSILLIKMHTKIEQLYPGRIKITDYFSYPTIAKLAEFIQGAGTNQPKELPIKPVELPLDYFNVEASSSKEVNLRLNFDESVAAKIFDISKQGDLKTEDILLAAYAYLFGQIAGRDAIAIQTGTGTENRLWSLDIDLGNVNKFIDLAGLIRESFKSIEETKVYDVNDISNNIFKDRVSVIPVFYKAGTITEKYDILNSFDIAMEWSESQGHLSCLCKYNGRRLNKAKMKEFAGLYLKLIELFLE